MRKLLCSGFFAVALAVVVALTQSGGSHAAAHNSVVRPASPSEPIPLSGRPFKSTNWSGYVTTSKRHRITAVKSTFITPRPASHPGYSSTWAGIGGFTSHDLIQAGTSEFVDVQKPGPYYFAWYEKLPGPETPLRNCSGRDPLCTVTAGDHITVSVKRILSGRWRLSVADSTSHWTWRKTFNYTSSRSSAEWILEAPLVGGGTSKLPRGVGTSFFGPTSTYTVNGSTRTIAKGNPVKVDMVYGRGKAEATPSPLAADGQSFNVCAYKSSCLAPP